MQTQLVFIKCRDTSHIEQTIQTGSVYSIIIIKTVSNNLTLITMFDLLCQHSIFHTLPLKHKLSSNVYLKDILESDVNPIVSRDIGSAYDSATIKTKHALGNKNSYGNDSSHDKLEELLASSYYDLNYNLYETYNYFAIEGHSADDVQRNFMTHRNYGGCLNDAVWLVVSRQKDVCNNWEPAEALTIPQIRYSVNETNNGLFFLDGLYSDESQSDITDTMVIYINSNNCDSSITANVLHYDDTDECRLGTGYGSDGSNAQGPICCTGYQSCRYVSNLRTFVSDSAVSNKANNVAVDCDLITAVNGGNIIMSVSDVGDGASIISTTNEYDIFCNGEQSCLNTDLISANNFYCFGVAACQNVGRIEYVTYVVNIYDIRKSVYDDTIVAFQYTTMNHITHSIYGSGFQVLIGSTINNVGNNVVGIGDQALYQMTIKNVTNV